MFQPATTPPPQAWIERPAPRDVARAAALRAPGIALGSESMVCHVLADGRLEACEDAAHPGRPAPILLLKSKFRLDPLSLPRGRVMVGVDFPKSYDRPAQLKDAPSAAALKARFPGSPSGQVRVVCHVSEGGEPSDCALDPDGQDDPRRAAEAALDRPALEAATTFRFTPAMLRGAPVASELAFEIGFSGHEIGHPDWAVRPTGNDLANAYPKMAVKLGLSGEARMHCEVAVDGRLAGCRILSEDPAGVGFGDATLSIASRFRMKPQFEDGKPVAGGEVTIPIRWNVPVTPASAADFKLLAWAPWTQAPTPRQVSEAHPASASDDGEGRASLRCAFDGDGGLTKCEVVSEYPQGLGFGSAALSLAPLFRISTEAISAAEARRYRVVLPFTFPSPNAPLQDEPIKRPEWVRTISADAVLAAFPEKAVSAGVLSGSAAVLCRISDTGALRQCAADREDPVGMGFGAAASVLAQVMQANLWSKDGEPTVGRMVRVPIRLIYSPDGAEPHPKGAASKPTG